MKPDRRFSRLSLWPHQIAAVQKIDRYCKAFRRKLTSQSALVQMPTGSGKTGVIAVAAHMLKQKEAVLILSPRIALCDQLRRHVESEFFAVVAPSGFTPPKEVRLWEGGDPLPTGPLEGVIGICTIQKIQRLFKLDRTQFDDLTGKLGLVLIDEGHYEPALEWREAIRAIPAPKIIFTATPFRNDFKLFDIDFEHVYRLSLNEALKRHFIREVSVIQRSHAKLAPRQFVGDVLDFYELHKAEFGSGADKARVIIRCDSATTIRSIAAELRKRHQTYVTIHENFELQGHVNGEYRHVPEPSKTDAIFWIHQYKLLEGIDDSRFQVVAPFDELRSARSVVQQVGRVLRNPRRKADSVAYFLDYSQGRQERLWRNYQEFEALVDREGIEALDLGGRLIERMGEVMPSLIYIDGQFRAPAVLEEVDVEEELMVPLSANLHEAKRDFDVGRLEIALLQTHRDNDHVVETRLRSDDSLVLLYAAFGSSPLLGSQYFIEPRLAATVVHRVGNLVFFLDTSGSPADKLPGFGKPVLPGTLRKLFEKDDLNRLTAVGLRGSNLGLHAIRTRSFTAGSIRETLPGFDDNANVCTTVRGLIGKDMADRPLSRYLGFSNGRVTDDTGRRVSLKGFFFWAQGVAAQLARTVHPMPVFKRYASEAVLPGDTAPIHILLEVKDLEGLYVTNPDNGLAEDKPLDIPDAATSVTANGGKSSFELIANGKPCKVFIEFDASTGRYRLESDALDRLYRPVQQAGREHLLHYLNREQAFRILPTTPGYFYTAGQFFKPEIQFGPKYDDNTLNLFVLLEDEPMLDGLDDEKGRGPGTTWPKGTLFRLLDERGGTTKMAPYLGRCNIQVCDDLETEAADFIFVDSAARRVVFAHAKAAPQRSPCSASAIQTVCSQAEKNARYLSRFNDDIPPKAHKWRTSPWKTSYEAVVHGPIDRIRKGPSGETGPGVWIKIREAIHDWRTSNEIWIVLGNVLSKSEFKHQLCANPPEQEAIQLAFKLFTTAQAANAVGARLRVFCMP
ncbi:MAG: DEAD/DEAH box helicase family protein [Opitutaceae bacterium]